MGVWDFVILGIILAAVIAAVIFVAKGKSKCSCDRGSCSACDSCKKKRKK